jgi:hypothetical protein
MVKYFVRGKVVTKEEFDIAAEQNRKFFAAGDGSFGELYKCIPILALKTEDPQDELKERAVKNRPLIS